MKKTPSHTKAIGLSIAALAATAAGVYYLYGSSKGKARRAKISSWALRAKAEVMDEIEQLKEVNEETYHAVVDKVMQKYEAIKDIDKADVVILGKRLKSHWKDIKKDIAKVTKAK